MTLNVDELSDFNEVEDFEFRTYNRGVVLANIFEDATEGGLSIKTTNFPHFLDNVNQYLGRIPPEEVLAAQCSMKKHLVRRGYMEKV